MVWDTAGGFPAKGETVCSFENILKRGRVEEGRMDRSLLQLSGEEMMLSQTRLRVLPLLNGKKCLDEAN